MNVELKKLTRTIYLVTGIILIALILLFWFLTRSFTSISVDPIDASISIDGTKVRVVSGQANVNVRTGDHLVSVDADGFIGFNQTLNFSRGFGKGIKITLTEMPAPSLLGNNVKFLTKGNNFNESYYLQDKTIYKTKVNLNENGSINILENRALTEARISNTTEIIWSPTKELALLRKPTGINLFDFMKYDFVHQTESNWGGNDIGSIAWSPDNSKIAYYYAPNTGEKSIIFANIINTDITRVLNLNEIGIADPILHWSPDSEWLLIIPRSKDISKNKIYALNTYSRALKQLTDGGSQVDASFSPDSNKILYTSYLKSPDSQITEVVSIMDKDGSNKQTLNIRAEIAKIAWSKDSRNIIVATTDTNTKKESLFKFDTYTKEASGFIIKDMGDTYIDSVALSDDEKSILYEAGGKLFVVKIN